MRSLQHFTPNRDGWHLALQQSWADDALRPDSYPVLIVPGYGMNSFIFGYHPRGTSLESALVDGGLEVWRVDLRAQGESRSIGGTDEYGLTDLAVTDLGAAIDAVLERTRTRARKVAIIGASLGGSLMFGHAALVQNHKIGLMVAVGAPVRWVKINPLLRIAFGSPTLAGLVRFKGTRQLAGAALPYVLRHTPWLLSIYMNPRYVDQSALEQLVQTVEDPNRHVNREIAQWIRDGDLVMRGVNVARSLKQVTQPLLSIVARADGIVPPETAGFAHTEVASADRQLVEVGHEDLRLAHADMFISDHALAQVFAPIRDFIVARPI
ncbi:MAG: alpha/beta fold hydrolase [Polyangiaceae bacterium]